MSEAAIGQSITVRCLLDPHWHGREGEVTGPIIEHSYWGGARLLGAMPNTEDGNRDAQTVMLYNARMWTSTPVAKRIHFIDYVQINEHTTQQTIDTCVAAGIREGKVYPKGRTTAAHHGVSDYYLLLPIVAYAGARGMRIHFHPEHPSEQVDSRDAEYLFIPIVDMFMRATNATIVWEHGTDARCIPHWVEWAKTGRFFITFTGHHLLGNESNTYGDTAAACKPPYRTEMDRQGISWLIRRNFAWVMAGTDSAIHPIEAKHRVGQCACGAFTGPFALQLYAHALIDLLATPWGIDTFNNFVHENACRFYGLGTGRFPDLKLAVQDFQIPLTYDVGPWKGVVPFWAGRKLAVTLVS